MRVRDAIRDLPASRIAEISSLGMGDSRSDSAVVRRRRSADPGFFHRRGGDAALQAGHTFYTCKAGLPELARRNRRIPERIAPAAGRAQRVLVSSSGMTALMLMAQALIDEGDKPRDPGAGLAQHRAAVTVMAASPA